MTFTNSMTNITLLSKEAVRPKGMRLVLILLAAGALINLIAIIPDIPLLFMGHSIYGNMGTIFGVFFVAIDLLIIYYVYNIKKIACLFVVPWLLFEIINSLFVIFLVPSFTFFYIIASVSVLSSIAALIYIYYHKEYFIC